MIPLSRIPHRVAVPALLALFLGAGALSMRGDSAAFDETAHIAAGVTYVETGDFRLNPEHPPLVKALAAVPLKLLGRGGGDYASRHWRGVPGTGEDVRRSQANQWIFGFEFLNGPRESPSRRDPAARLLPARGAVLVLGALLGLAVYAWAKELWGPPAGLLALLLAVTCPTLLAHARLVTTDLASALGFTTATWVAWRWTRVPSWRRAALLGGALGAALLLKYSCALLAPLVVATAGIAVAAKRLPARRAALGIVLVAAIAYVAIWAGYGFRFAASPDPDYVLEWAQLERRSPTSPAIRFAMEHRLFPEAYLYGLAYAKAESIDRTAFLDGEESIAGWYRYFPEAFLLKTPLAFILLVGWALGASLARTRGGGVDGWIVALPPLLLAWMAITSRFNIGHRHLTPIYPFLCLAAAPAAGWMEERGRRGLAAAALVAGCVVSFALATPGYLSYFNVLAGGPRGGWKHLVDSNIDWGQDLLRLKRWMDANGVGDLDLAYFGTADPRAYGIRYRKVAAFLDFYQDVPTVRPETGRYLAASVTFLQGVYLAKDRGFAREIVRRGWVPRQSVEEYLAWGDVRRKRGEKVPGVAEWMMERGLIDDARRREVEDGLPAVWLERVRTTLTPIGRAGDSILIYRIP